MRKTFIALGLLFLFGIGSIASHADDGMKFVALTLGRITALTGTGSTAATSFGLGTASTQNIGTSGANVPLLSTANTWSAQQVFSNGLQTGGNISGSTTSGVYTIGADSNFTTTISLYGSANATPNVMSFNATTMILNPGSGGITITNTPITLSKLGAAPTTAPGAGKATLFFIAGTTGGTCKLQAMAGTSTTPVTVIDNVGAGC